MPKYERPVLRKHRDPQPTVWDMFLVMATLTLLVVGLISRT